MRLFIILSAVCALVFFSAGFIYADELSDLKEQVRVLQETTSALSAKIQALESKQSSVTQEIEKVPELEKTIEKLKESPAALLQGVNVGGHIKATILDRTQGERNGDSRHTNLSGGINTIYLFLSKEIEDWLKLDVELEYDVSASATPALGSNLTRATSATQAVEIYQAYATAPLKGGYELKVGAFKPLFSEDYARDIWWEELIHQNKGLCYLQSYYDYGVELYKNFDFDKFSLPTYLEVGNGSNRFTDTNDSKTVLLHIAPEFFQTKLRFPMSISYGKWDDGDNSELLRAALGYDLTYDKWNFAGEYLYSNYGAVSLGANKGYADGKREGYYLKAAYRFNPKWRALVKYAHSELYKTGLLNTMRSDNYDDTILGLNYFLSDGITLIGEYSHGEAVTSDGSDKLNYNRGTIGARATF